MPVRDPKGCFTVKGAGRGEAGSLQAQTWPEPVSARHGAIRPWPGRKGGMWRCRHAARPPVRHAGEGASQKGHKPAEPQASQIPEARAESGPVKAGSCQQQDRYILTHSVFHSAAGTQTSGQNSFSCEKLSLNKLLNKQVCTTQQTRGDKLPKESPERFMPPINTFKNYSKIHLQTVDEA